MPRLSRAVVVLLLLAALAPSTGMAQAYPAKLVRMVVAFPTGGPTDPPARWIAQKLSENFGQTVIVDFKGGASGNIGTEFVAKAAPDGYTLLFITSSFYLSAVTASNLPFDPVRDFAPISPATSGPTLFVVHPSLGISSVRELVALAKKSPGKLTFGSSGQGGPLHLYAELFKYMAGVDMLHVPYKGAGPAVTDIVAGRIDTLFVGMPAVVPFMKTGKVVAIGTSSMERAQTLPDLPSIHEQGLTGFDGGSRYGLMAPARTPAEAINRVNAGLKQVLFTNDTRKVFGDFGLEPIHSSPAEFGSWIKSQIERWTKVAAIAGIKKE